MYSFPRGIAEAIRVPPITPRLNAMSTPSYPRKMQADYSTVIGTDWLASF
jgi:hypothetical protein